MRIAFYAPMKAPDHPLPSGDRQIARLLMTAMEKGAHSIEKACSFRSYDGTGSPARQNRISEIGSKVATRLTHRYAARSRGERPDLWFTYHLYHKAPDWLGPAVSRQLNIPYVICEASHAPKRANGPWAAGLSASELAIAAAEMIICLNSDDRECLEPWVSDPSCLQELRPFIDISRFAGHDSFPIDARADIRRRFDIADDVPVLLSVAMMRSGDKLASFRALASALTEIADKPWRLLIAGDGPAAPEVRQAFVSHRDRIVWLGQLTAPELAGVYQASDIYVWPAINEAFGLAFLEAQAFGLPVVSVRTRGVPDVVADGESGLLANSSNAPTFASAISRLLDNELLRRQLGDQARRYVRTHHDLPQAVVRLNSLLQTLADQG
jgi:glycosyltransferase involved in cell wall biosynthesis